LLGYQFSPRLADLADQRLWRLSAKAKPDYGPLSGVARQRVNGDLIARHWDDLLRLVGSLSEGAVAGSEALRLLQSDGRYSTLGRAVAAYGRIAKSLFLLSYLDDQGYRRRVLQQINRQEGRHRLARALFYGQKGELRQHYREGQEDQLAALGLVLNMIVLWNTRYTQRVLEELEATGQEVRAEDVDRLSPLGFDHITILGRYHFVVPESVRRGEVRPLRTPLATDIAADRGA
jgi:TnpA family transposase